MALITCPDCGAQISSAAASCPQCGCPMTKMKKCPECKADISEQATVCPKCGHPLNKAIISIEVLKSTNSTRWRITKSSGLRSIELAVGYGNKTVEVDVDVPTQVRIWQGLEVLGNGLFFKIEPGKRYNLRQKMGFGIVWKLECLD